MLLINRQPHPGASVTDFLDPVAHQSSERQLVRRERVEGFDGDPGFGQSGLQFLHGTALQTVTNLIIRLWEWIPAMRSPRHHVITQNLEREIKADSAAARDVGRAVAAKL